MTTVVRRPSKALRRNEDPPNAHEAIRAYDSSRQTRADALLAHLRAHYDVWFTAVELSAPDLGGFQGTRRLRELRERFPNLETKRFDGNTWCWCLHDPTTWQR